MIDFFEQAADHPRTFYGLLATRVLGRPLPFNWTPPSFKDTTLDRLMDSPRGYRAVALMQIGDYIRAEAELKELVRGSDRDLVEGVHALAARGNMASLAVRLDTLLFPRGGGYDGAAFPIPDYRPKEGFNVDRALVYALIRQESRCPVRRVLSRAQPGCVWPVVKNFTRPKPTWSWASGTSICCSTSRTYR